MNWTLALNPINIASHLKQEHLYHQYLHDRGTALRFKQVYIPPVNGNAVLDYGCGRGRHVAMLAQCGYNVLGIDQARFAWWPTLIDNFPSQVTLSNWGFQKLSCWSSHDFDLCLCFLVLYLIEDDQVLLEQFHRVLKPRGYLVLQVPSANNLWTLRTGKYLNDVEPIKRYYTKESITAKVEKAGFMVERTWFEKYYSPNHLKPVNTALGLLPEFVGKWAEQRIPPENRGLINLWAQK